MTALIEPGCTVRSVFGDRRGTVIDLYDGLCGVFVTYVTPEGVNVAQDIATVERVDNE